MTNEEWDKSTDPHAMLRAWFDVRSDLTDAEITALNRFAIACCWKHKHLIPQEALREGLVGAEQWLAGEIDYEKLNELNWHAEAEAFAIDYAKTPEEIADLKAMIASIRELDGMAFEQARERVKKAAYFAEITIVYYGMRSRPRAHKNILLKSDFLCADLLREHIQPDFDAYRLIRALRSAQR